MADTKFMPTACLDVSEHKQAIPISQSIAETLASGTEMHHRTHIRAQVQD